MGGKNPHFFKPIMLEVIKDIRVRKDNTYVPITRYILTNLRLDLHSEIITIKVLFYRNDDLIFTKLFNLGKCGDTNVNDLINQVHQQIQNEG
jgi:hypothetical protein